jgi:hypothetical protein
MGNLTLLQQMPNLGEVLNDLHHLDREKFPINLTNDVHSVKPGKQIWIRVKSPASPASPASVEETFVVIVTTPTAIKVAEITPWIHPPE